MIFRRRDTDERLEADAVMRVLPQLASEPTRQPVEEGAAVTDHLQPQPWVFEARLLFGRAPRVTAPSRNTITEGGGRIYQAWAWFEGVIADRVLVDVIPSRLRPYERMAVTGVSGPLTAGNEQELIVTLQEVRIASAEFGVVRTEAQAGPAANETDEGDQGTDEPDAQQQKDAGSVAKWLVDLGSVLLEI